MPNCQTTHNQKTEWRSLSTFAFIAFTALSGCQGQRNISRGEAGDVQALAHEILGPNNSIELNGSNTYALCFQTPTGDHARRKYRYLVVALPNLSVIREGVFSMGSVKWLDDERIEVRSDSTSIRDTGTTKIINVTSAAQ